MTAETLPAQYARVVVDTNVLISAALSPGGAPALLVDRILRGGCLVFSDATFAELETRLWRSKFDRYLSLEVRRLLLHDYNAAAFWADIPPAVAVQRHSRDPDDDAFVHAALAAGATRLVSGDDDLLCLHPIGALHVITARAALDEIDA